jgi:hypothetical protein
VRSSRSEIKVMCFRAATAAAAAIALLSVSACGGQSSPNGAPGAEPAGKPISAKDFDRRNFDRSTVIDNAWFPLRPGTQLVFEGSTREDGAQVAHRVVFTVTDLTKVVNGVRAAVIWERDFSEGQLVETELAFFAQDNDGNVWHLGQYPEEYEEGKFVAAPAWLAGTKGARAGISMKAEPRLRTPSYSQGFAPPPINWVDRARVHRMGVKTCVPLRCYEDVLVTREFETGKPEAYQVKYYARGVGNVRVGWAGANDKDREVLVLVKLVHANSALLARFRTDALKLERRAYRISKDVYGRTSPAKRRP